MRRTRVVKFRCRALAPGGDYCQVKGGILFFLLIALILQQAYAQDLVPALKNGETVFMKFCAGCHGFEGEAAYQHAPSFSLGDRMHKDDRELLQSVLNGKNNMPPWRDKLPVQDLRNAISYLRLMYQRHTEGEAVRQTDLPDVYYLFKPVGEQDMDWTMEEMKRK